MSDLAKLAKRLEDAPRRLETDMRRAVEVAGELLGQAARRNQPTSGQLRNVGKSGARIGVAVSVRGEHRPAALIRATGPVHLLDNPSAPHSITAKTTSVLALPGHPVRGPVQHPGVRVGKRTFERGVVEALPRARAVVEQAFAKSPASW